jgi:hypothetical protein
MLIEPQAKEQQQQQQQHGAINCTLHCTDIVIIASPANGLLFICI